MGIKTRNTRVVRPFFFFIVEIPQGGVASDAEGNVGRSFRMKYM